MIIFIYVLNKIYLKPPIFYFSLKAEKLEQKIFLCYNIGHIRLSTRLSTIFMILNRFIKEFEK